MKALKFGIATAITILLVTVLVISCDSGRQYRQLTELHQDEIETALSGYWQVMLSKEVFNNLSLLQTVATGEELRLRISNFQTFSRRSDTIPLRSVRVLRVIEYTTTCSQAETDVSYGGNENWNQSGSHDYMIFIKEDVTWKVAFRQPLIRQGDISSTDRPLKSCSDFAK